MTSSRDTVSSHLTKLQRILERGDHYEALQMFRTTALRFAKQKRMDDATELLVRGAHALLDAGQDTSAVDLVDLLVDQWQSDPRDEAGQASRYEQLNLLLEHMPVEDQLAVGEVTQHAVAWRAFVKSTVKYCDTPEYHHLLAVKLAKAHLYEEAERHFYRGPRETSPALHGRLLFEMTSSPERIQDRQFVVTRTVLTYLSEKRLHQAALLFHSFTQSLIDAQANIGAVSVPFEERRPNDSSPPIVRHMIVFPHLPLINFCQLLLLTVQRRASKPMQQLRSHYGTLLSYDPVLLQRLDQVGVALCHQKPASGSHHAGGANMLSQLMKMMGP